MSVYSDWQAGAITDDEYKYYTAWEDRRDRYYEEREAEKLYYDDDDDYEDIEDDEI